MHRTTNLDTMRCSCSSCHQSAAQRCTNRCCATCCRSHGTRECAVHRVGPALPVFTMHVSDMMAALFGAAQLGDEDYDDEELEAFYYNQAAAAAGGYQAAGGGYQAQAGSYEAGSGYQPGSYQAAAGGGAVPRAPAAAAPSSSRSTASGATAGQQPGSNTASASSRAQPGRTATATATAPLASNTSASASSGAASRAQAAAAAQAEAPAGAIEAGEKSQQAGTPLTAEEELQHLCTCVVCLSEPRSVLLLPCKHLVLCSGCSDHLQGDAWRTWLVAGGMVGGRRGGEGGRPRPGTALAQCPVCRQAAEQHVGGIHM